MYAPSYERDDGSHPGAFTEEARHKVADEKYTEGMRILRDRSESDEGVHLGKALPYLRSACRLSPNNSTLWNDLGVVEMRTGLHEKARLRFHMALNADGTNADALNNLAVLRQLYGRDGFFENTQDLRPTNHQDIDIKHRVRNLTRIGMADLGKKENWEYFSGKQPFILTGAMTPERGFNQVSTILCTRRAPVFSCIAVLHVHQSFWNIDNLAAELQFSSSFVDFYPVGMFGAGTGTLPYFLTVPRAIKELWAPTGVYDGFDGADRSAYIQWNVGYRDWKYMEQHMDFLPRPLLTSDFDWLDECWSTDSEREKFVKDHHWRIMLVGVKGAGMFNHKDTLRSASWQAITAGAKRFHICDSAMDPYIYMAGDVDTFAPDYNKYPLALELDCYLDEVRSGEILYYPRDYWHHSKNLVDGTVALTGTLVNAWNFDSMTEQLLATYISQNIMNNFRECDPLKDQHSGSFCEGMKRCFDRWIGTFGKEWLSWKEQAEENAAPTDTELKEAAEQEEAEDGKEAVDRFGGIKTILKAAIPADRPYDEDITEHIDEMNM
jgi:hypothetical protein